MAKKKSEHYVNNKDFLEAITNYRIRVSNHHMQKYGREPTKTGWMDQRKKIKNIEIGRASCRERV